MRSSDCLRNALNRSTKERDIAQSLAIAYATRSTAPTHTRRLAIANDSVRDGESRTEGVRDGSVRQSPVREGSLRQRPVRDGSLRQRLVRDGSLRYAAFATVRWPTPCATARYANAARATGAVAPSS